MEKVNKSYLIHERFYIYTKQFLKTKQTMNKQSQKNTNLLRARLIMAWEYSHMKMKRQDWTAALSAQGRGHNTSTWGCLQKANRKQRSFRTHPQHTNKTTFKENKSREVQRKDVPFHRYFTASSWEEKCNYNRTIYKILTQEVPESLARPKRNWRVWLPRFT